MVRSKSTSGGRRRKNANVNEEAIGAGNAASTADTNARAAAAGATSAEAAAADRAGDEAVAAPESRIAPESRKLEVVRSEPRKKVLVPINLEDEIRRRAYEIYEQRGNAPGSESEDWLAAEREVRERYHQQQTA